MSKVLAQFKYEAKFHITHIGLVITGEIISGNILPGNHIRFEEDGVCKTAQITGVPFPRTGNLSSVSLFLRPVANNYFDTENENLIGRVFDIIE